MQKFVVALLFLSLVLPCAAQKTVQISRSARFEASFRLPDATGSPFDPVANDVQVTFHGPAGLTEKIPAFWDGDGIWKVRFAPPKVGSYTVNKITLTHYVPALAVLAKGNARAIFFWAYAQTRPYPGVPPAPPLTGTLRFGGLAAGTYALTLWNTATGRPIGPPKTVKAANGIVTVAIPRVPSDVAGWLERR